MNDLVKTYGFQIVPQNLNEAWQFAEIVSQSQFCPSNFRGKPGDCLLAMQFGSEIGVTPMQAIQNIAVINGRTSIWGDLALALVKGSNKFESIQEHVEGDGENIKAVCKIKRVNEPEHVVEFSVDDAKKAKLWGKQGPWTQYTKRMMQLRARGFALRDAFPDVLKGIITREEAEDYTPQKHPVNVTPKKVKPDESKMIERIDMITDTQHRSLESTIAQLSKSYDLNRLEFRSRIKNWLITQHEFTGHLNEITDSMFRQIIENIETFAQRINDENGKIIDEGQQRSLIEFIAENKIDRKAVEGQIKQKYDIDSFEYLNFKQFKEMVELLKSWVK